MTSSAELPRRQPDTATMSRRHATGGESARNLLFTVLGEFVLRTGRTVWTSSIIDVLSRLEVEEKAARQALMRMATDGWLTSERIGRRTRWTLTDNSERLLTAGTSRIYGFTGPSTDWDGRLVFVLARVPESDRSTRHHLRTQLTWAGFGSPAPGVWISTHTDHIAEAETVLRDTGILAESRIFVAEHRGGADLPSMITQAWDLDALDQQYQDFIARFSGAARGDPLGRQIELVHAWRRFPWIDPGLPAELLPRSWSGSRAARVFARKHATWAAETVAAWIRLNDRAS